MRALLGSVTMLLLACYYVLGEGASAQPAKGHLMADTEHEVLMVQLVSDAAPDLDRFVNDIATHGTIVPRSVPCPDGQWCWAYLLVEGRRFVNGMCAGPDLFPELIPVANALVLGNSDIIWSDENDQRYMVIVNMDASERIGTNVMILLTTSPVDWDSDFKWDMIARVNARLYPEHFQYPGPPFFRK